MFKQNKLNNEGQASLQRLWRSQCGQGTLEILIALSIFALTITAAVVISFGSQSISVDSELSNEAIYMARQQLEKARADSINNFSSVVSASTTDAGFLKELVVEPTSSYEKKITSRVSWTADFLRSQKVELTTILSDWKSVLATGGDTGGSGTTGDWKNPRTLGSIDLGPGNSATDLDVLNKIVYLSSVASDSKKPDFYIVDATNGQSPSIASSLNTGSGLNSLDVAGNYVYAANQNTSAQLQVINVSNINSPSLINSFKLPGVSGSGAVGNNIFYYSNKIYIGTKKATGPEFFIIDVSDPANPLFLGSKEINDDVNRIYIKGNFAYLAVPDEEELKIFDVSDPQNIIQTGAYNALGETEDGKTIFIVGNNLYLGRLVGGNHANHHEFYILDIASSSNILSLGSKDIAADVNGIVTRDNIAFLGTSDSNKEFQVFDVSNPNNITLISSFNFPQVASGVDYEDNIVYVSVRSNDALRIITSGQ